MRISVYVLWAIYFAFQSVTGSCRSSKIESYVNYHLQHYNFKAVLDFLRNLESMNDPEGLFLIGMFYLNGYTTKENLPLANQYFFRSAHLGFTPAFNALADSYLKGDGLEKNSELALYYYECAARKGYGPGQFNAGVLLKDGKEVAINLPHAYKWLDQAAKNPDLEELCQDAKALRDEMKL